MRKIFRFLYDSMYGLLLFITGTLFLMGIMWNRNYISFFLIKHTYTEKVVIVENQYSHTSGNGSGPTNAETKLNGERVVFHLLEYLPIGSEVTIWYSPRGSGNINAIVKREGEQFDDLEKRLARNFIQFFMALNMPFLLLVYYGIKFFKEDKKNKNV